MAIDPKLQFKAQQQALADKFQTIKELGSYKSRKAGLTPEDYRQVLADARTQFKADQEALKQKFAQANPNSRFFGTKPGALRNVPDEFDMYAAGKPTNFNQLKEQRLIGQERNALRAPGDAQIAQPLGPGMKKGGKVKLSSASKRADGCAVKGKTRGRMV